MSTSRDFTAGQVLTAAQVDDLAQGKLGFGFGTSNVGPTSGTTSLDIVAASAVTLASATRFLKITAVWRSFEADDSTFNGAFRIQEGSTVIAEQLHKVASTGVGQEGGTLEAYVASATATSHTYKLTLTRIAGAGVATVQAAATYPLSILVEDIGAA